ncbi:hypothetical protein V7127_25225 [Bacillus sp. JJ1773]
MEIKGLDDLHRMLKTSGIDFKLLKTAKEKVNKMIKRIEEKEEEENGKN